MKFVYCSTLSSSESFSFYFFLCPRPRPTNEHQIIQWRDWHGVFHLFFTLLDPVYAWTRTRWKREIFRRSIFVMIEYHNLMLMKFEFGDEFSISTRKCSNLDEKWVVEWKMRRIEEQRTENEIEFCSLKEQFCVAIDLWKFNDNLFKGIVWNLSSSLELLKCEQRSWNRKWNFASFSSQLRRRRLFITFLIFSHHSQSHCFENIWKIVEPFATSRLLREIIIES